MMLVISRRLSCSLKAIAGCSFLLSTATAEVLGSTTLEGGSECPYLEEIDSEKLEKIISDHGQWLKRADEFYDAAIRSPYENLYDELMSQAEQNVAGLADVLSNLQDDSRFALECPSRLKFHKEIDYQDLQFSTFSGSVIEGVIFNASFDQSNFNEALIEAELTDVTFRNAYMEKSTFIAAVTQKVNFGGAYLKDTYFHGGSFQNSFFNFANLSGAHFENTTLVGSEFIGTNLNGTLFEAADLRDVWYEPNPEGLPNVPTMMGAENLEFMYFKKQPYGLIRLRSEFRKLGFEDAADKITFALRRSSRVNSWNEGVLGAVDAAFQYVMFELTVAYGLKPGRALQILLILIIMFSAPYFWGIRGGSFWKKWDGERILNSKKPKSERVECGFLMQIIYAIYFSFLSAFHIGWREINIGTWLSRMQPKEYQLAATGWYRTISTFQSIVSLYLLALWGLAYFGNPFG